MLKHKSPQVGETMSPRQNPPQKEGNNFVIKLSKASAVIDENEKMSRGDPPELDQRIMIKKRHSRTQNKGRKRRPLRTP